MNDLSKVSVVLPSLDPDEKLVAVIDGLLEHGFTDIILINDGSKPENLHYFTEQAALHPEITLLHHEVNKGKGAALKNAFRYFLDNRPEGVGVVTVDGDNQHHPADTRACAEHMMETGHCVLGCRDFNQEDVPARSSFGNKTTSLVFKIFCSMTISDTQTGLRALPRQALETLVDVAGDRFEYETNMLLAFKQYAMDFDEVKIRTVYIEENKSSHFRVLHDSWRIYKLILAHFFRFAASSLITSVIEILLVFLLDLFYGKGLGEGFLRTVLVAAPARFASSVPNFLINKNLVFRTNAGTAKSTTRYFLLVIAQFLVQLLLDEGAFILFGATGSFLRTVLHTVIMVILYFVSYMIQQSWVFAPEKKS